MSFPSNICARMYMKSAQKIAERVTQQNGGYMPKLDQNYASLLKSSQGSLEQLEFRFIAYLYGYRQVHSLTLLHSPSRGMMIISLGHCIRDRMVCGLASWELN